jgi:hypothetical protein
MVALAAQPVDDAACEEQVDLPSGELMNQRKGPIALIDRCLQAIAATQVPMHVIE